MNESYYKCHCQVALCQVLGKGCPQPTGIASAIASESMLSSRLKKKDKNLICNEIYRFHGFALRNPQPNEVGSSFVLE